MYQDIQFLICNKVKCCTRIVYFDTQDYETRLYSFENDLPGMMTNRCLYGRGIHWYLLFRCSFTKLIDFGLKISNTYYESRRYPHDNELWEYLPRVYTISFQIDIRY